MITTKNSKNINSTKVPLDISGLVKGQIFKNKKKNTTIIIYFLLPVIGINLGITGGMIRDLVSPEVFSIVIYSTIFFPILFLILDSIWTEGIKQYFYSRGIDRFMSANQISFSRYESRHEIVPDILDHPLAENKSFCSAKFDTGYGSVMVADYELTIGSGKSEQSYKHAFACLTFTNDYPHIYLDGTSNGSSGSYSADQEVQLQGNFNKYFKLFMPDGSSSGTLAVLSPDIMQMLIDVGRPFDIEIKKNKLYLINEGPAFTQENIAAVLKAAEAIYKDFAILEKNWQPVYDLQGKPYVLRKRLPVVAFIVITGLSILFISLAKIITDNLKN